MSRQEKRKIKQERLKKNIKKESNEPVSKGTRIFVIAFSLTFIFLFFYLANRDNSIPNNELSTIHVTLKDAPKYHEYSIKSTTHRDIIVTTKEFNREFRITGNTYRATDHNALKSNIFAGDRVELKVKKSDLDNLDENSFWNTYNDFYGLSKNGNSYIDIELRTELTDKDSKWMYGLVILGLVMLPYGFIKGKPLISIDKAVIATAVILLIIILLMGEQ
jgi:hypothetical protein